METAEMRARLLLLFFLLLSASPVPGKETDGKKPAGRKAATLDHCAPFLINNIFNYYSNNGGGSSNPFNGDGAFEFPKGSREFPTFADGIIWAGYHKGRAIPKMGGSVYRHGLQAGKILLSGTASTYPVADDPTLPKYRLFRVRPDVGPARAFDRELEALLQTEEVALTGRYEPVTARGIYDQYLKDWNEWPASDGAPYEDVDGNGVYNPGTDIPGVPGAGQTLWYVANDASGSLVPNLGGSPPIGLEMQKTIWGYRWPGAISDCIFISTKIINRSGAPVDSMYIGQWADADIGDSGDDVVGCDTTLKLGYTYDGATADPPVRGLVPAVGFVLLSGPLIPGNSGDSAIVGLRVRRGFRSLPPAAFTYMNPSFSDYVISTSDAQWYCLLRGRTSTSCASFIDPTTGQPSVFYASGDPVRGAGWVDAVPPYDRKMLLSSGPFTFANGDTQGIVVAHLAASGADRLSSVFFLKESAEDILLAYSDLLRPRPSLSATIDFPVDTQARIILQLDGRSAGTRSVIAIIRRSDGSVIQEVPLFDDGLHADGLPGDALFGGTAQMPAELGPVDVDVRVTDVTGSQRLIRSAKKGLTISGPLSVEGPVIFSENLFPDGKANPGENLRYGLTLKNRTSFGLTGLVVLAANGARERIADELPPGGIWEHVYDAANPKSYMTLDVPASVDTTAYPVPLLLSDTLGNVWHDSLFFPAAPSRYMPAMDFAARSAGSADGRFGVLVIDRRSVRDHTYRIRAFSPDGAGKPVTISLEDSTDGRVLLSRHEVPDSLGHTMPLTDGFKLLRGNIDVTGGRMKTYTTVPLSRLWTWAGANGLQLEGFSGAIGNAFDHWQSGGVPYERQRDVRIVFARTDTAGRILDLASPNASFACRFMQNADKPAARAEFAPYILNPRPGYAYQDYSTQVPFAAYDVDTIPARRLMVGYLENNVVEGSVDGRYWPPAYPTLVNNTVAYGPREWFFVFDLPYGTTPSPLLEVDLSSAWTPMMWFGTPSRNYAHPIPLDQDTFSIITWIPARTGDIWSFNPVSILGGPERTIPSVFEVLPNYPNPFNAGTTIKYALPFDARVIVRIYNILGQQVRLLADGSELEGYRSVRWDGKNDRNESVGSGVYFYRLEALSKGESPLALSHVGKMVVLR